MFKRRKDSGFTLIELMIVIAVIGILAVVLIPKVGVIKTQAKSAGIDTNMRVVEGFVQSRITYWTDNNVEVDDIFSEIRDACNELENPLSDKDVLVRNAPPSNPIDGAIYVQIEDSNSDGKVDSDGNITITGIGKDDTVFNEVIIHP